jgi:hypothetical protein
MVSTEVLFLGVVAVVVVLLVVWIIGVIRKVGGCLIHLVLLAAALCLFLYLTWLFWERFLQG